MNKLLFVGDLHGGDLNRETGRADDFNISKATWKEQSELDKSDVLIQTGDFGYIWFHEKHDGRKKEIKQLEDLASRNFTLAFVDGNHENFDLINKTPVIEKWGGLVNEVFPGIFRLRRGEVYTINGKKIFTFGGARSNSNQKDYNYKGKGRYKKERKQKSWWEEEIPSTEEFDYAMENLSKYNYEVDIIVTHTCPVEIMKSMYHKSGRIDYTRLDDPVSLMLDEILSMVTFKEWHFGHHHQDIEIITEDGKFFCHYQELPMETEI